MYLSNLCNGLETCDLRLQQGYGRNCQPLIRTPVRTVKQVMRTPVRCQPSFKDSSLTSDFAENTNRCLTPGANTRTMHP